MSDQQQQQRHVPYNSESELDAYEPAPAGGARGSTGPAYVQQNSESESELDGRQQPQVSFGGEQNDDVDDAGRGRRGGAPGVTGFAAQTGTYAEPNSGDDEDTLPPLVDARARSRTPRGNRSKSRSRSRARAEGGLRTEVLMNEDSDSGLEGESAGSDAQERVGRGPASYVPQNEGSGASSSSIYALRRGSLLPFGVYQAGMVADELVALDDHPLISRASAHALAPPSPDTDGDSASRPARKHINTSGPGQTARSRSRSQNRQVRYQPPMNSESESDEVVTEYKTATASKDFQRLDRIDVPMNSESERDD